MTALGADFEALIREQVVCATTEGMRLWSQAFAQISEEIPTSSDFLSGVAEGMRLAARILAEQSDLHEIRMVPEVLLRTSDGPVQS